MICFKIHNMQFDKVKTIVIDPEILISGVKVIL